MNQSLFLEGPIQTGKSTIILNNLKSYMLIEHAGGFLCQRLTEDGKTKAFRLIETSSAETTEMKYCADIPDVFLEEVSGKWIKRDEVFKTKGIEILSDIHSKKLILLDEIGGFEILIDNFREKLYEALSSCIPVIGVIKSVNNGKIMKSAVGISNDYLAKYEKLRTFITNNGGRILNVNSNIDSINEEIKLFLSKVSENKQNEWT